jgi:hypothetical protein
LLWQLKKNGFARPGGMVGQTTEAAGIELVRLGEPHTHIDFEVEWRVRAARFREFRTKLRVGGRSLLRPPGDPPTDSGRLATGLQESNGRAPRALGPHVGHPAAWCRQPSHI